IRASWTPLTATSAWPTIRRSSIAGWRRYRTARSACSIWTRCRERASARPTPDRTRTRRGTSSSRTVSSRLQEADAPSPVRFCYRARLPEDLGGGYMAIVLEFVGAVVVVALLVRGISAFMADYRKRRGG